MRIGLCFLTLNELEGCRKDIPQFDLTKFDQVFAIDGNSTDGTVAFLQSYGIAVYPQPTKGLNAACLYAFNKCTCDALVLFHPKGSIPVSDAYHFEPLFEKGYDLVIGSRIIKGAINEEDGKIIRYRKWFVMFLGICSSVLFRKKGPIIWDVLHGFRGMRVDKFNELQIPPKGATVDLAMVSQAYKKNMEIIEFPTHEGKRVSGETHFRAIPTGKALLKYLIDEFSGRNNK